MILAIDPGPTHSGYALIEAASRRPVEVGKISNDDVSWLIEDREFERLAIEMVASYGMAVGREVFETCVWIGRFQQHALCDNALARVELIYRRDVKLHHCGSAKAKDANIAQALRDRFAAGQPNRGKGTQAEPGWFHGFAADIWQAYALAVLVADELDNATKMAALAASLT